MSDGDRSNDQDADRRNEAPADKETFDLREKLAQVLRGAINLRVVTASGEAKISGPVEGLAIDMTGVVPEAITNINLVEGDIVTLYRSSESEERFKDVHEAMLAKAEGIVDRNVRLLLEVIKQGMGALTAPRARKTTNASAPDQ